MCNDRDAARIVDDVDHFGESRPVDVDATRPPRLEKAVEGLLILLHDALLHEPACEVSAGKVVLVVGKRKRALIGAAYAVELLEPFADKAAAPVALGADAAEECVDAWRIRIDSEPHDVHDASSPSRRDLHAGNEPDAELLGGGRCLPDAVHRIVVRQRHELHAVCMHETHEVGGRKLPVGNNGVHVQVDDHQKSLAREVRSNFLIIRPRVQDRLRRTWYSAHLKRRPLAPI